MDIQQKIHDTHWLLIQLSQAKKMTDKTTDLYLASKNQERKNKQDDYWEEGDMEKFLLLLTWGHLQRTVPIRWAHPTPLRWCTSDLAGLDKHYSIYILEWMASVLQEKEARSREGRRESLRLSNSLLQQEKKIISGYTKLKAYMQICMGEGLLNKYGCVKNPAAPRFTMQERQWKTQKTQGPCGMQEGQWKMHPTSKLHPGKVQELTRYKKYM